MKQVVSIFLFLSITGSVLSSNPEKPVSDYGNTHSLFKIERSRDTNYLTYSLNVDDSGEIISSEPIQVFWKNLHDSDFLEPLTAIQQKYAYGIKILDYNRSEQKWSFQLVSYPDKTFKLIKTGNQSYRVTTTSGNQEIIVSKIFIRFENNSFWFPSISSVMLYGQEILTSKMIAESIK